MRIKILVLGCVFLLLSGCVSTIISRKIMREEYFKTQPDVSSEVKEAILNGEVLLGMSVPQVLASRGYPGDRKRSTGSWGVHEQWCYSGIVRMDVLWSNKETLLNYKYAYIYFENGVVTSWQSTY